jgi:hypothetical protein
LHGTAAFAGQPFGRISDWAEAPVPADPAAQAIGPPGMAEAVAG